MKTKMSKKTHSKESAVRKKIDQRLVELGWITDEDNPNCNVFTERAKTEDQNKKFLGNEPDYVLYKSKTDNPLAIIETKRKGSDLDEALKKSKKKYIDTTGIKLLFVTDSIFMKTYHLNYDAELTINDEPIDDLISEMDMLKFAEKCSIVDNKLKKIDYTKDELIKIYKLSNELLREDGLREGAERFTEFANILFLKYLSEIDARAELYGKDVILKKNKRWDKIKEKTDDEILDFVNDTVFSVLSKAYADKDNIFKNKLQIKNGYILKEIVDKLSTINILDAEMDIGGDAFEYFLKESVTVGNDLGEYFTPRHIINFMIRLVKPKFGESVYDPACGTGGFLIAVFDKLKKAITLNDKKILSQLQRNTLFGRELTDTYKIAKMNMILRGDGHNNIKKIDSLKNPIDSQFDLALANIPYSQKTKYGNYYACETTNGDISFIMHILKSLKDGGRASVIVPQGFLFRTGIYKKARKYLMQKSEIKAIISLPSGVFEPYAGVSTAIIYFVKGKPTKKIWFYYVRSDGYTLNKQRKKIDGIGDIDDAIEKYKNNQTKYGSCCFVELADIAKNDYNLNTSQYVDISKQEKEIDIRQTYADLHKLFTKQENYKKQLDTHLNELGIKFE